MRQLDSLNDLKVRYKNSSFYGFSMIIHIFYHFSIWVSTHWSISVAGRRFTRRIGWWWIINDRTVWHFLTSCIRRWHFFQVFSCRLNTHVHSWKEFGSRNLGIRVRRSSVPQGSRMLSFLSGGKMTTLTRIRTFIMSFSNIGRGGVWVRWYRWLSVSSGWIWICCW